HHQKIRHQHARAGIVLRQALTKKKRQQREPGDERAVERDRRIVPEKDAETAERAQHTRSDLQDGDDYQEEADHSGQGTFGEVAGEPIEIAATIEYLVEARLEKQDRE